ncbi:MAG: hypothetical protein HND44_01520 [Chloroflexi bacterium]|nr:hypothetical protein [Ardenticatenaceae bacterium]NOG33239.1 hypothetical protein [Chloroflexota bacterium]
MFLGQDRPAEALAAFRQAGDCFAQEGNKDSVIALQSFQAYALWQMGRGKEALALSAAAVAALEQTPGGECIQDIYWHHSQILADDERRATNDEDWSLVVSRASEYVEKAYRIVTQQAESLPDEAWQEQFWRRPLHNAIRAAWQARQPQKARVCLPRLETAVAGRTAVDQTIEIEWTPTHPDDAYIQDKVVRRRRQLARLLAKAEAQGGRPTIADLAAALNSSPPTIKRDLAAIRRDA